MEQRDQQSGQHRHRRKVDLETRVRRYQWVGKCDVYLRRDWGDKWLIGIGLIFVMQQKYRRYQCVGDGAQCLRVSWWIRPGVLLNVWPFKLHFRYSLDYFGFKLINSEV